MCLTRCSMSDIDGDKLVMPGCLVRGPPTYSRNLCVPRVGLPKLGDSVQTFREVNVGEFSQAESIRVQVVSIRYDKI
jgi:hypothetical protein